VILGHHGGEAPLLQAALATAGSLSLTLALFRVELSRLGTRLRLGTRNRDNEARADGAATKPGGER
jgi:hypothetical protein